MKKTTFILPDRLMQKLREKAAYENRSLSSIVEEAVHSYISASEKKPRPGLPPLPTYDGGGFRVDVANREALYELLDREDDRAR